MDKENEKNQEFKKKNIEIDKERGRNKIFHSPRGASVKRNCLTQHASL